MRRTYCLLLFSQSRPTLCNRMDYSTPGFPVLHCLSEFAQTHVHCVSDAMQPFHPLLPPSPSALNLSHHQGLLLLKIAFLVNCDFFNNNHSAVYLACWHTFVNSLCWNSRIPVISLFSLNLQQNIKILFPETLNFFEILFWLFELKKLKLFNPFLKPLICKQTVLKVRKI